MRFVFPNVTPKTGIATPVEVRLGERIRWFHLASAVGQVNLGELSAAYWILADRAIPREYQNNGLLELWVDQDPNARTIRLNGQSYQLAAILAMVHKLVNRDELIPPGLAADEPLWATGALRVDEKRVLLARVDRLEAKLERFAGSDARFFLVPSVSLSDIEDSYQPRGLAFWDFDAFAQHCRSRGGRDKKVRAVVKLEAGDVLDLFECITQSRTPFVKRILRSSRRIIIISPMILFLFAALAGLDEPKPSADALPDIPVTMAPIEVRSLSVFLETANPTLEASPAEMAKLSTRCVGSALDLKPKLHTDLRHVLLQSGYNLVAAPDDADLVVTAQLLIIPKIGCCYPEFRGGLILTVHLGIGARNVGEENVLVTRIAVIHGINPPKKNVLMPLSFPERFVWLPVSARTYSPDSNPSFMHGLAETVVNELTSDNEFLAYVRRIVLAKKAAGQRLDVPGEWEDSVQDVTRFDGGAGKAE